MKFSYSLIKKIIPDAPPKARLIEALNLYSFEAADAEGDVFEVSIPPNRFSDAASHLGLAKEISAIFNVKEEALPYKEVPLPKIDAPIPFKIAVEEKKICRRYLAGWFENVKISSSPAWMRKILKDCGLRPINNVVDIMNYAMLETGQPLHAFDADKFATSDKRQGLKGIIVRRAKQGEKIKTLDGQQFILNPDVLVIADESEPLAIAGVKGGQKAEVDAKTKSIIMEAANFDGVNIYRTSRSLNLTTDASLRFSHHLSPVLAEMGMARAAELLEELTGGRLTGFYDSHPEAPAKKIIEFDVQKFSRFIGVSATAAQAADYLRRLGFFVKTDVRHLTAETFLVEVPALRLDIDNFEDLTEEVSRLIGYNDLKPVAPTIALRPAEPENIVAFKNQLRQILVGLGLDEVYNYSFVSEKELEDSDFWDSQAPELVNPVSAEFQFLRPNLAPRLLKNVSDNFRFFSEVKIFEIAKVFKTGTKPRMNANTANPMEGWRLGIALASKNKETIFELKGIIAEILEKTGLSDYFMRDLGKDLKFLRPGGALRIESDHSVIGYLGKAAAKGHTAVAEIDVDKLLALVEGELGLKIFEPLPQYPAVSRDLSILVSRSIRIGDLLEALNSSAFKYIEDVDLIDEYESEELGKDRQSLTFRIVFRSSEKTLKDEEVDREMAKIVRHLEEKFKAETRS